MTLSKSQLLDIKIELKELHDKVQNLWVQNEDRDIDCKVVIEDIVIHIDQAVQCTDKLIQRAH